MTFKELMASFGYEVKTTFWEDFTIADVFGPDAVQDTFNRAFGEWKSNYIYLTELVIVLNHKIWQHYELSKAAVPGSPAYNNADILGRLYDKLWKQADGYACEHLKGSELEYFYRITD